MCGYLLKFIPKKKKKNYQVINSSTTAAPNTMIQVVGLCLKTFEPSIGGMGNMLNMAKKKLIAAKYVMKTGKIPPVLKTNAVIPTAILVIGPAIDVLTSISGSEYLLMIITAPGAANKKNPVNDKKKASINP